MKRSVFSLSFFALGLACCGEDKSLVVGEERAGSEGASAGAGVAGSAGAGGSASGGSGGAAGAGGTMSSGGGNDRGGESGSDGTGGRRPGPGPGPGPCEYMAVEYRDRLRFTQTCMPMDPDPCTLEMPEELLCDCTTYVNPRWDMDIVRMRELIEMARDCPRQCEPCRPAVGGVCMTDTNLDPPRAHCFARR
jgi:hypothetical protein